ncbi:MAG: ABC transporter substrate-binding protein [Candidatus Kariarchaeaceae archaeon]
MFKRKIDLAILLLIMINIAPSTAVAEEAQNELIYAIPYDLDHFNYYPNNDYPSPYKFIISATHARLFTRNHLTGDFKPSLADGEPIITFEGNSTIIDVSLKSGLKFYDGSPLKAEDVVFTYKMALTPGGQQSEYYHIVKFFDSNDSIIEVNDLTVKFILNKKYSLYKNSLTLPIKSKAYHEPIYETEGFPFIYEKIQESNSAGPFMVTSFLDNILTLDRNPNWFGSTPILDKIIFKKIDTSEEATLALTQGQIDLMDPAYYYTNISIESEKASFHMTHDTSVFEISINHDNPYLNGSATPLGLADSERAIEAGKYVRKAISHLVNREEIVNNSPNGLAQALSTIVPCSSYGWSEDFAIRKYNPSLSKEYLELAGFDFTKDVNLEEAIDENNSLFTVYLMSPSTSARPFTYFWMASLERELPKIGIHVGYHMSSHWGVVGPLTFYCETRPPIGALNETSEYPSLLGWDIFSIGYSQEIDWDPTGHLDSASIRPNGENFYNFESDEFDTLLKSYLEEFDNEERLSILYQMQEFLYDYEPLIPVYTPISAWGVSKTIQGLDLFLLSKGFQEWAEVSRTSNETNEKTTFLALNFVALTLSIVVVKKKKR